MDVAVDIDEQLTTLMALATQPPAIVHPYFDTGREYQNLLDKLSTDHQYSQKVFKVWFYKVEASRNFMIKIFEENATKITSKQVIILSQFALLFEKTADLNSIELTKYKKQSNKTLSELNAAIGEEESAKITPLYEAAFSQWQKKIEVYLDMALLLRGLAGKYDPDQEIVFTAKSSEDIDKFFESLN